MAGYLPGKLFLSDRLSQGLRSGSQFCISFFLIVSVKTSLILKIFIIIPNHSGIS